MSRLQKAAAAVPEVRGFGWRNQRAILPCRSVLRSAEADGRRNENIGFSRQGRGGR